MQLGRPEDRLQASLTEITRLLQRHRVLETLTQRQESTRRELLERLQHQQNLVELQTHCRNLHPAELAFVLESLPLDERSLVWSQVPPALKGQALVEVSEAVRNGLVEQTPSDTLLDALRALEADDLAYLEGKIPPDVWSQASRELAAGDQTFLRETMAFPDDSVGRAMSRDVVAVREAATAGAALADIRSRDAIPREMHELYVVDERNVLRGAVLLGALVRAAPETPVATLMTSDLPVFAPGEPAEAAVKAFGRYDLLSGPVTDDRGKLLGRLTATSIRDLMQAAADRASLKAAGLRREEDLFAPVLDSARNRWPWLVINLLTAFFASRVIGLFEQTISQLVALASLMPIVASIGGNTGNQTVALVVRGLALEQLHPGNTRHLVRKELIVSLLNGALWGSVMGVFALAIYHSLPLGLVMTAAVLLNLVIAALVGVATPVVLQRLGRDPAQGSSVLLTFATDSFGFFLFLGLAWLFLI